MDEAAILTNGTSAVRLALEFIDGLCTEPIRRDHLEKCKEIYKPPKFTGKRTEEAPSQQPAKHAKLWIVKVDEKDLPKSEQERYAHGEAEAEKLLTDEVRTVRDSVNWPHKPKMADELELGDWMIVVMKEKGKTVRVNPPGVFLYLDRYVRDPALGKERFVFHYAIPEDGESMSWRRFHKAVKSFLPTVHLASPRTMPIWDAQVADELLKLWTPDGLVSRL